MIPRTKNKINPNFGSEVKEDPKFGLVVYPEYIRACVNIDFLPSYHTRRIVLLVEVNFISPKTEYTYKLPCATNILP